ncbi:hypothetical protein DPMN_171343 [Dreissena polymorpha]|uniref:Uncharacterized protein n=1 Tax=Dreissena polymorpha TaxID=45954 RepID=A0A9D4DZ05_DREPO|nr:hypothetical protein DPMN_171343 [Dreissena polymorpha]
MCVPVYSQIKKNTFHDKDNAANKDAPVAEERNSNLRQDDSSFETLDAKDEKEALTDPIHNKVMVREYERYASFAKNENKMDSISFSTSRLAFTGFYYNLKKYYVANLQNETQTYLKQSRRIQLGNIYTAFIGTNHRRTTNKT